MVNHMFFSRYTHSEKGLSEKEKFVSLSMVYALVRFVALGNCESEDALTDAVAAAFRLISHTDFDRTGLHLARKYGLLDKMGELISI